MISKGCELIPLGLGRCSGRSANAEEEGSLRGEQRPLDLRYQLVVAAATHLVSWAGDIFKEKAAITQVPL